MDIVLTIHQDKNNPRSSLDWFALKSTINQDSDLVALNKRLKCKVNQDTRKVYAEGTRQEWKEIVECLREEADCKFKRAAVVFEKQGTICFFSPRNANGSGDYLRVSKKQALETLYKGLDGEYHYGDAAWDYVKKMTGVDLKGILEELAKERVGGQKNGK